MEAIDSSETSVYSSSITRRKPQKVNIWTFTAVKPSNLTKEAQLQYPEQ